ACGVSETPRGKRQHRPQLGNQESIRRTEYHRQRAGNAAAVYESESEIASAFLAAARRPGGGYVRRHHVGSDADAGVAQETGIGAEDRRHADARREDDPQTALRRAAG